MCSCIDPCSARAGSSMTEGYPVRSHVIQPQLPCPLTFPFPISANTYYSRDLKGISKSAQACKSILAARAHSSILKYLGDSSLGLTRLEPSSPGVPRAEHTRAGSCPTLATKISSICALTWRHFFFRLVLFFRVYVEGGGLWGEPG